MNLFKTVLRTLVVALGFTVVACELEDEKPLTTYESGVFVVCEGPFQKGSGDVYHYNRTVGGVTADLFSTVNGGAQVGNILQSMNVIKSQVYLVANNSNRVVLADPKSFKFIDSVRGLTYPRYTLGFDTAVYITEWGQNNNGAVRVYSLNSKTLVKSIPTGKGADKMLQVGATVFVLNNGGFSKDSTITVVTALGDSVLRKLNVALGPNSIVSDANGDIWVLCGGYFDAPGNGKLLKIRNYVIERTFDVPKYASNLVVDPTGYNLYYTASGKIFTKDILNFGANPPVEYLAPSYLKAISALGVDPKTGYLYCGDAADYASKGLVCVYQSNKALVDSFRVGVIPSSFYFR